MNDDAFIPTRRSLLSRLKRPDDERSWREFFQTYGGLIKGVASKAGLSHAEAQDVVQETLIIVARKIPGFKYDPALGSFKSWLLLILKATATIQQTCRSTRQAVIFSAMRLFKVSVVARNTKDESMIAPPVEVLVDTGSELTWLPKDLLTAIKVAPLRKRSFSTATKQLVTRETGYAIVSAEGYETVDEVVFAEPGDMTLLGVRTIEGFGVMVDNIAHRFVATATLVAPVCLE